jgi:hypothetical protein
MVRSTADQAEITVGSQPEAMSGQVPRQKCLTLDADDIWSMPAWLEAGIAGNTRACASPVEGVPLPLLRTPRVQGAPGSCEIARASGKTTSCSCAGPTAVAVRTGMIEAQENLGRFGAVEERLVQLEAHSCRSVSQPALRRVRTRMPQGRARTLSLCVARGVVPKRVR